MAGPVGNRHSCHGGGWRWRPRWTHEELRPPAGRPDRCDSSHLTGAGTSQRSTGHRVRHGAGRGERHVDHVERSDDRDCDAGHLGGARPAQHRAGRYGIPPRSHPPKLRSSEGRDELGDGEDGSALLSLSSWCRMGWDHPVRTTDTVAATIVTAASVTITVRTAVIRRPAQDAGAVPAAPARARANVSPEQPAPAGPGRPPRAAGRTTRSCLLHGRQAGRRGPVRGSYRRLPYLFNDPLQRGGRHITRLPCRPRSAGHPTRV